MVARKVNANDKSPISEIAAQHVVLIPISASNMLCSNFATRTFVGRIKVNERIIRLGCVVETGVRPILRGDRSMKRRRDF
jgi:hypothetical protein